MPISHIKATLQGGPYDGEIVDLTGKYHCSFMLARYFRTGRDVFVIYTWALNKDRDYIGKFRGWFADSAMTKRRRLREDEKKAIAKFIKERKRG